MSGKPQFHFLGVCGYNKLVKFNEANLVFADVLGVCLYSVSTHDRGMEK